MSNQRMIRILIAEDDYLVGRSTAALLKKMGYTVIGQAINGLEAVEMTQSLQPDVILMDIKMPVMDGIEATRHIYETRPTPVVALTAYATPEVVERAIAAGMGTYLIKPASVHELERAISITIARFDDMMGLRRLNAELQAEIAERKRTEEALTESVERYRDLVEKAGIAILLDDREGGFRYFNETFAKWFGYSVEEMNQQSIRTLVHPDDVDRVMEYHTGRIEGRKTPSRYEFRGVGKDGSIRYLEVDAVELKDGDSIIGTSSYLWDITERKQAEEALRESHERFLTIVDGIDADVYVADMDTYEILFMNEHMRDSFGHDLVGKICWDVFRGESGPCGHCTNDKLVDADGNPTGVHVWEGQNPLTGNWYMNYDRAIKWIDGRLVRLQIATDVTERNLAEEEIRRRNRELAALNSITAIMMQSALDLDEVLQRTADGVVEGLGCNTAIIFLRDEKEEVFKGRAVSTKAKILERINAAIGFPVIQLKIPARSDFNEAASNILDGRITIKHDFYELAGPLLSRLVCSALQGLLGSRTFLGLPLLAKGKVVGGIFASTSEELGEEDTEKLMTFANQAAIAIENARLYEAERDQRELAEALRDTAETLNSTLDFDEVLDRILTNAGRVVPHDAADIMLVDSTGTVSIVRNMGYVERGLEEWAKAYRFSLADFPNLREIFNSEQPLVIPDTQAYVGWVDIPETRWIRSYVCAPIPVEDQVVGFISLSSTTPGTYNSAHAERLQIFANQAAIAIKNARLYDETRQRALEQETLREAALALTTALDRNKVVERILAQLQQVVPYDSASVQLLREDRMELVGGRGFPNLPDLLGISFPADGDNPNSEVVRTRAPFIVEDAPAVYEVFRTGPHQQTLIRSWLGVPMLIGEQLVGMIALDKREPGFYTQEHARLAEAFAVQAAVAIENARLFGETEQRVAELDALRRTSLQLTSSLDLAAVLDSIAENALSLVGATNCHLYLYDETSETFTFGAALWENGRREAAVKIPRRDGLTVSVVREGHAVVINDAPQHPLYTSPEAQKWGVQAIASFPLKRGERVVGVFSIAFLTPHIFSQEELRVLGLLADQAAIAIENARLFTEAEQRATELSTMLEAARAVSSTLDLQQVLALIAEEMVKATGVAGCTLSRWDREADAIVTFTEWRQRRLEDTDAPGTSYALDDFPITRAVLEKRQPISIMATDPATDLDEIALLQKNGSLSLLMLPLVVGERVIGLVELDETEHEREFTDAEIHLCQALADQVAVAIENARLFEEEKRRSAQLALINNVGEKSASILDLDRLMQEVTRSIQESFNYYNVALLLLDEGRGEVVIKAIAGGFDHIIAGDYRQPLDEGIIGFVARTGDAWLANDISKDPYYTKGFLGEVLTKSELCVPIGLGDEVIGALDVQSIHLDAFDQEDVAALETVADRVAIAIQNARLFEETRRRAFQLQTIEEVGRRVSAILDPDELFPYVTMAIQQNFGYHHVDIFLVDPATDYAVFKASSDSATGKAWKEQGLRFKVGEEGMIGWVVQTGEPLLANDVRQEPRYISDELLPEAKSELVVPLKVGEQVVGVLDVDSDELNAFDEDDLFVLQTLANQIAIAIENARLYEETKQRAEEMTALHETALDITIQLEMQRLLNAIITRASDLLGATGGLVHLYDPARERLVAVTSHNLEQDYTGLALEVGEGVAGKVFQTGQPLIIDDYCTWSGKSPQVDDAYARSMLGVPLRWQEQVIGVLDIMDNVRVGAFDERDLGLLTLFANQAAIAIENARLYKETQQQSERLAQTLAVSELLHRDLKLEQLLEQIAQGTVELGFRRAVINVYQPGEELVRVRAVAGLEGAEREALMDATYHWSDFQALMQDRFQVSRSYLILHEEVDWERDFQGALVIPCREDRGPGYWHPEDMLLVPLWGSRGEPVGLLSVDEPVDGLLPNLNTIQTLEAFANQAAIAIENAHLFEELEERQVYLEGVLGAAPDAIATLDAHNRLVEWNPGAERLFGYSWEEAVGKNIDDLITNPDVVEEAVGFTRAIRGGEEIPPTETVRYRKDGSPVDVVVAGSPILVGGELIGIVAVYTDITARKRLEEALRALALLDELTGLYNRRGLSTLGQQQLKASNRTKRKMVLLFADFDDLKQINDTLGHTEGDRALIEVADVFRETFRESDIIARIGGDEFVVLAIETNGTPAEVLATRFQKKLKARNAKKGRRYKLSLSVGIARYDPEYPGSIDELLAQADRAMYEKKRLSDRT